MPDLHRLIDQIDRDRARRAAAAAPPLPGRPPRAGPVDAPHDRRRRGDQLRLPHDGHGHGPGARRGVRRRAARRREPPRHRPGAAQGDAVERRGRPGAHRPPRRHQLDGAGDARRPAGVGDGRARLPCGQPDAFEEAGHGAVPAARCAACTPTTAATRRSPAPPSSSSPRPAGSSPPSCEHAAPVPGAGASRDQATLVAVDRAVAPEWATVRADFPYRKEGRRAPDRPPKLMAAVRDELAAIGPPAGTWSSADGRWAGGSARWSRPAPTASRAARHRSSACC